MNLRQDFKALLRKSGYKATPTRVAVLSFFQASKSPVSPQEIIDHMADTADQATLYRILKAFEQSGIIRRIDFRHNHPHYELVGVSDHHHIVCTQCGRSEDIELCMMSEFSKNIQKKSRLFTEVSDHSFELFGICVHCTKKKK